MNNKKAIVFFSAGLGDALLLVPVIRRLKNQGYTVSGLFNSNMPCREMMAHTGLLDELIDAKTKFQQGVLSLRKMNGYDLAVLNYFACTKKNLLTASLMAKEIVINRQINGFKNPGVKIKKVETRAGVHDAVQNLQLIGEHSFSMQDLSIPPLQQAALGLPEKYIALQVSAGNPAVVYKDWPLNHWIDFLRKVLSQYKKQFVLLGNQNDTALAEKLKAEFGSSIISLAGKTTLTQAMQVLSHCQLFLGQDGGLMHLATAFGKPTFTIWGPSSEKLYGYEQFDAAQHRCVRLSLNCFPCSAWIGANHTKAAAPELCPDHACMKQLTAEEVFVQFSKYVNLLPAHVW